MHKVDMKALDKILGNVKAIEIVDKRQRLELELRMIEFWDADYYAHADRDSDDICKFNARQLRKRTILQEIGQKKDG